MRRRPVIDAVASRKRAIPFADGVKLGCIAEYRTDSANAPGEARLTNAMIILTSMPKLVRLAVSLGLAGACIATAHAETQLGAGAGSCGDWVARRNGADRMAEWRMQSWALGFLSGVGYANVQGLDPLRNITADTLFVWLDRYCATHVLAEFSSDALPAFIKERPQ